MTFYAFPKQSELCSESPTLHHDLCLALSVRSAARRPSFFLFVFHTEAEQEAIKLILILFFFHHWETPVAPLALDYVNAKTKVYNFLLFFFLNFLKILYLMYIMNIYKYIYNDDTVIHNNYKMINDKNKMI